jgi:hypothetical protein
MKNKIITAIIAGTCCLFYACSGDHVSNNSKDTVINTYKTPRDTSKPDTSKATSSDNSATGGAGNAKDTSKKGK